MSTTAFRVWDDQPMDAWMLPEVQQLTARYGTVPPPWIYAPDEHPYSAFWRMGGGESLVMILGAWWDQQGWGEAERVAYFRRFPPPPRWLEWTIMALWDLEPPEDEEPDWGLYFERAEVLGFGSRAAYEQAIEESPL